MANYTTNLCPNPSFQLGTQGYTALLGSTLSLDTTVVLYSTQSLLVQTPGIVAGEGVITAGGLIPTTCVASASLYIQGSGNVTVNAVANPGGTVVTSVPITLTGSWQRVTLNQINATPGQTIYLMVFTSTKQETDFWISGVQVEPESPAHAYCDGDQIGCFWVNGSPGGVSVQQYTNPTEAVSNTRVSSNLVNVLAQGEVFNAVPLVSASTYYAPYVASSVPGPVGAMSDFAIFELTDQDPAMTYPLWTNAGTNTGTSGAYNRVWGTFFAPQDQIGSSNQIVWSKAAYMAAGFMTTGLANNASVNVSDVQVEILPMTTGRAQPSPSGYDNTRALHSIIKPDRLNFCPNPSIEINTNGWSAVATASIAQDSANYITGVSTYLDEVNYTPGSNSLNVTVNANGDGASITLTNLIAGDTYIASAYVMANIGLANISMTAGGTTTSIQTSGGTGYGAGTYGGGFYGGSQPLTTDLPTQVWYRVYTTFVPTDSTATLTFFASAALDVAYPTNFWIDAVLVEAGEVLGDYFDGSYGGPYYGATKVNTVNIGNSSVTATPYTTTIPTGTGIQANDLIVIIAASNGTHVTNGQAISDSVNGSVYTALPEVRQGGGSSHYSQVFYFYATAAIPDGTTFTYTPYASSTGSSFAIDVYRGTTGAVTQGPVPNSVTAATSQPALALSAAPAYGNLVLTFDASSGGTLTPGSNFNPGSSISSSGQSVAIGYQLSADGVSTYATTWTDSSSQTAATQTVSFGVTTAPSPTSMYSWEVGGVAHLSRSYLYDQLFIKKQAVNNVLNEHTPLGISFVTPLYAIPYTQ